MKARPTLLELRCARCGAMLVYERFTPHCWSLLDMARYQRTRDPGEPAIYGSICPECAESLLDWWASPPRKAAVGPPA
jgi:hypothetical protein